MSRTRWVEGRELGGVLGYVFGGPELQPVKIGKKVPIQQSQGVPSPQTATNRTSRGSGTEALLSSVSPDTQLRGLIRSKPRRRGYFERPDSGYGSIRTTSEKIEDSIPEPTPSDIQEFFWDVESHETRLELEALKLEMQELAAARERENQRDLAERAELERWQRRKDREAEKLKAARKAVEEERQALARQREARTRRQKSRTEHGGGDEDRKKELRNVQQSNQLSGEAVSPPVAQPPATAEAHGKEGRGAMASAPAENTTRVIDQVLFQHPLLRHVADWGTRMTDLDWGVSPGTEHSLLTVPPQVPLIPPAVRQIPDRTLGTGNVRAHPASRHDLSRSYRSPFVSEEEVIKAYVPLPAQLQSVVSGEVQSHPPVSKRPPDQAASAVANARVHTRSDRHTPDTQLTYPAPSAGGTPALPLQSSAGAHQNSGASISNAALLALLNDQIDQQPRDRQPKRVESRTSNQAPAPPPVPARPVVAHNSYVAGRVSSVAMPGVPKKGQNVQQAPSAVGVPAGPSSLGGTSGTVHLTVQIERTTQAIEETAHGLAGLQAQLHGDRLERDRRDRWEADSRRVDVQTHEAWQAPGQADAADIQW